MTAFATAIGHNLRRMSHISTGRLHECVECNPDTSEAGQKKDQPLDDEGSFSRYGCDSCGSPMAGMRYAAHGVLKLESGAAIIHLDICMDCLSFHANGDEPEVWP